MKNIKKAGIALGGGAVLGAAHVGVLKAVEEANIEITHMSGTSIGAFVAAFYAFGVEIKDVEEIALELKWYDISNISLSKFSLLSNEKIGDLIREHIGDKNIEDANIPLAIVATDITNGKKVVLDKGSLAQAVMASTCLPGIFKPIIKDDAMLVDGGIVENVPIDTLRKMGADTIIGVDLNASHNLEKPSNILDVITNSFHLVMKQTVQLQTQSADLMINPDLSAFNRSDTSQVQNLIKQGYDDAKKQLTSNT